MFDHVHPNTASSFCTHCSAVLPACSPWPHHLLFYWDAHISCTSTSNYSRDRTVGIWSQLGPILAHSPVMNQPAACDGPTRVRRRCHLGMQSLHTSSTWWFQKFSPTLLHSAGSNFQTVTWRVQQHQLNARSCMSTKPQPWCTLAHVSCLLQAVAVTLVTTGRKKIPRQQPTAGAGLCQGLTTSRCCHQPIATPCTKMLMCTALHSPARHGTARVSAGTSRQHHNQLDRSRAEKQNHNQFSYTVFAMALPHPPPEIHREHNNARIIS